MCKAILIVCDDKEPICDFVNKELNRGATYTPVSYTHLDVYKRQLRPLPLLRFAVSATGGAHLCSIQYYLRFWLSSCRASLTVSALRIVRYCLRNFVQKYSQLF